MNIPEKHKIRLGLIEIGFIERVSDEDGAFLLNEITKYIFNTKNISSGEKIFDYELDYKYYYCDFIKLGYDLNEDMDWWKFDTLLEGIFLQKESTIGKVIEYRTYEKPPKNYKTFEEKEHKFYMERKRQYALPQESKVDENFEKMWNYLQTKKKGVDTP